MDIETRIKRKGWKNKIQGNFTFSTFTYWFEKQNIGNNIII